VRFGRIELHPGIGGFWASRWAGPLSVTGIVVGARFRYAWDEHLSSGVGGYVGPGRFSVGPIAELDSDAALAHFSVTLVAIRVSSAVRVALDVTLTGWRRWGQLSPPATEAALWSRLSIEFLL